MTELWTRDAADLARMIAAGEVSSNVNTVAAAVEEMNASIKEIGQSVDEAARVATEPDSPRLTMAIPRKLVPSSPVRNLMRRVIREAHRHASVSHPQAFSSDGHWALRFQLVKVPTDAVAPTRDPSGRVLKPFARRPTDRLLKQRIRAEADALLHRLLARVSSSVAATPS